MAMCGRRNSSYISITSYCSGKNEQSLDFTGESSWSYFGRIQSLTMSFQMFSSEVMTKTLSLASFLRLRIIFHILAVGCHICLLNVKLVWHKHCKQRVDRPLSLVLKNKIRQSAPPKLKMCCVFCVSRMHNCFMVWYGNSNVQGQLFILRAG